MQALPLIRVPAEKNQTALIYKVLLVLGVMSMMAGLLTGGMTYMQVGFGSASAFLNAWLRAFLGAVLFMMPLGFVAMTLLTKFIRQLLPSVDDKQRNLLVGLIMAVVMESLMAFIITVNNIGFVSQAEFLRAWSEALLLALPLGLALMSIISMTIKPRLEQFLAS